MKTFPFLLSVLFFFIAHYLLSAVLPVAYQVRITAQSDHADNFKIYYARKGAHFHFHEKYSSAPQKLEANQIGALRFKLSDVPLDQFRLDTGDKQGVVRIYEIVVSSHFGKEITFDADHIYHTFYPGKEHIAIHLKNGFVEIVSRTEDPYILSSESLSQSNNERTIVVALALIFSLFFYFGFSHLNLNHLRAIVNIDRIAPVSGQSVDALDGLRGMAALMVVADHTWGLFKGVGASGVWIFFSLSGFFLARVFVQAPGSILSFRFLIRYFLKRFRRILPMYYSYIIVIYVMSLRLDVAVRHFFFLQGDGHLWAIPQEMLFYLVLPLIMLINYMLFKGKVRFILPTLFLLMVGANRYIDRDVISLYGMDYHKLRAFIGVFLAGVFFSYLYYGVYAKHAISMRWKKRVRCGCQVIGIVLIFALWGVSNGRLWGNGRIYAQIYFGLFGFGAGLLVFCVIMAEGTFLGKLLAWPLLRSVGVVSFSIYLLHPLIMNLIRTWDHSFINCNLHGWHLFVMTLVGTYLVACCTYQYIEKPFLT